MKRNTPKYLEFSKKKNFKIYKLLIRASISKRHRKINKKRGDILRNKVIEINQKRRLILSELHKPFLYNEAEQRVEIIGDFGLEDPKNFKHFIYIASKCIDENSSSLKLSFKRCTRVWPSAITMLCSLTEWIEYSHKINNSIRPSIASSDSDDDGVDYYLQNCGFYDFVHRRKKELLPFRKNARIVRIRRENDGNLIPDREDEIMQVLRDTTIYSKNDLELFDSIVLSETFLNVQEHGVTCNDQGWWVLAQHHPSHKFISLNIADNGVGFRHNLMTGPQARLIESYLANSEKNDGNFIKLALEQNISGAFDAKEGTKVFINTVYERGARRGNGLKRIRETCKKLNIQFTILSHYGYIMLDGSGKIINIGSSSNRIFGGTLYNYLIPAEKPYE